MLELNGGLGSDRRSNPYLKGQKPLQEQLLYKGKDVISEAEEIGLRRAGY